jgi:adenosine deaminase
LVTDIASITSTTTAVLNSFQSDNVVYLELRTTPRSIPSAGISTDLYISTVCRAISDFEALPTTTLRTKLILSIDRRNTLEQADATLRVALTYRPMVVGLDLCGDPSKGDVALFGPVFARGKAEGLGLTLHFGEVPDTINPGLTAELETLLSFEPDRLGHVIHVPEAIKSKIKEKGIGLELCVTCNVKAGMIAKGAVAGDHHFGEWWKSKTCPVILCVSLISQFPHRDQDCAKASLIVEADRRCRRFWK